MVQNPPKKGLFRGGGSRGLKYKDLGYVSGRQTKMLSKKKLTKINTKIYERIKSRTVSLIKTSTLSGIKIENKRMKNKK